MNKLKTIIKNYLYKCMTKLIDVNSELDKDFLDDFYLIDLKE